MPEVGYKDRIKRAKESYSEAKEEGVGCLEAGEALLKVMNEAEIHLRKMQSGITPDTSGREETERRRSDILRDSIDYLEQRKKEVCAELSSLEERAGK